MRRNLRATILLSLTALLLFLLAAGWWSWRERHRLVPQLAERYLDGVKISALEQLQLSPAELHIGRIQLLLRDGTGIDIRDLRLHRPLKLLIGNPQGSRLHIAELAIEPSDQPPATVSTDAVKDARGTEKSALRLSELTRQIRDFTPQLIQIDKLRWAGPEPYSGQLTIERNRDDLAGELRGPYHNTRFTLLNETGRVKLRLEIQPDLAEEILQLHATFQQPAFQQPAFRQPAADRWRSEINLSADIGRLARLPLVAPLLETPRNAAGNLSLQANLDMPDRILQLEEYRNISVGATTDSIQLPLAESVLGAPLEISLSTDTPLAVQIRGLRPLAAESLTGNLHLNAKPPGSAAPLLEAHIETRTDAKVPRLTITGQLRLQSAASLLSSARWRTQLEPLQLGLPKGEVNFQGDVNLAPLQTPATANNLVQDFELRLLTGSSAQVELTAADKSETPLRELGWKSGIVSAQLASPLVVSGAGWPGALKLRGGQLQLVTKEGSGKFSSETQLQNFACDLNKASQCAVEVAITTPELTLAGGGAVARKLTLTGRLDISFDNKKLALKLAQLDGSAETIDAGQINAESVQLAAAEVVCNREAQSLQCTANDSRLFTGSTKTADIDASGLLQLPELHYTTAPGQTSAKGRYSSENLSVRVQKQYQAQLTASGDFALENDSLSGSSRIQASPLALDAKWQHSLKNTRGHSEFTLQKASFNQQQKLSGAAKGLPVDLVAGEISGQGRISWPQAQQDSLQLQLREVAAVFGETFAVGISGGLHLQRAGEAWVTPGPQSFKVETMDPGIPVRAISFDLSLNRQRDLALEQLRAELLDGTLASQQLLWNLNGESRESLLELSGISLKTLTRELETGNFAATGILDARIPLITEDNSVTVKKGTIKVRDPGGRLRYYGAFSPDMLTSNPQLKLLAGALEDYNYRELSGTVEYPPSGDMQLELKLVGRSASVAENRDLIINLNLENNIPAMLRSLQASRDLTEALEKQLK